MKLDWLQHLTTQQGPFATVSMDATRNDETGEHEIELRAQAHGDRLRRHGAPADVVSSVVRVLIEPTGRGGPTGRLVVATGSGVHLDLVLPQAPVREEVVWGPVPHLLPAVRAFSGRASYVLAEVDAKGADLQVVNAHGDAIDTGSVDGDHDVLHKFGGGGWSHRRFQMRVEDSIEHNAGTVAETIATKVRRFGLDLVLLAGEPRSVVQVVDQLPQQIAQRAVRLEHGGRAAGTDDDVLQQEVSQAVDRRYRQRRDEVLDRFRSAEGRQREAAQGLDSVVEVLQRSQVEELLLRDDPSSDLTLWSAGRPDQLAQRRGDLEAMGVTDAQQVRADAALVWALVGTGGSITVLGVDEPGPELVGGVGAVLRWVDESTPRDRVPSMPGHGSTRRHTGPDT